MTTAAHPTPGPSRLSTSRPQSGLRAHTGHTLDSHLVRGQSRGSKSSAFPGSGPPAGFPSSKLSGLGGPSQPVEGPTVLPRSQPPTGSAGAGEHSQTHEQCVQGLEVMTP